MPIKLRLSKIPYSLYWLALKIPYKRLLYYFDRFQLFEIKIRCI
ncbi:hypothetical protein [Bacillus cereus]